VKRLEIAVAMMLTTLGCTQRLGIIQGGESSAAAYYPLEVGNRWEYSLLAPDGKEVEKKGVQILRQEGAYFVDNQGGRLTHDAFGVRDDKRYLLRDPLEAGKGWTNVVSVSSIEHYKVMSAGEECDAPAGKFQGCVRVEATNRVDEQNIFVNEFTFAPEVGIVRMRTAVETGGRRIPQLEIALKSFHRAGTQGAGAR
jgi:hypothetical protein